MKKGKWEFHSGDPELIGQKLKQVTKPFRDPAQLDNYLADFEGIKTVIQRREIEVRKGKFGKEKKMVWEYTLFRVA